MLPSGIHGRHLLGYQRGQMALSDKNTSLQPIHFTLRSVEQCRAIYNKAYGWSDILRIKKDFIKYPGRFLQCRVHEIFKVFWNVKPCTSVVSVFTNIGKYLTKYSTWTIRWGKFGQKHRHAVFCTLYITLSGFGGLGVACWPLVPKFAGSNPAEAVGFLGAKKSSARLPSEGK